MTKTTAALILAFVAALALWALFTCGPALSAGYEPEPTATVAPQALSVIIDALRWERRCHRSLTRMNHARSCIGLPACPWSSARPARSEPAETWRKAGRLWRMRAVDYRQRVDRLVWRMEHPDGHGWERWRPLVRLTWPAECVDTVVQIIRFESGGREYVYNEAGSGAFGLVQLLPKPARVWGAKSQLVYAYHHKYIADRRAGGSGWRPWAGCRAFQ